MRDLTELERLNLVARAETAKALLYRSRIPLALLSAFVVLLAVISGASFYETLAVRALAVLAVATTVVLWLKWRHAVYFVAMLFFAAAILAWLFDDPDYHTSFGSTSRLVVSAMLAFAGYRSWANGATLLRAQSESFEKERLQVEKWLVTLTSLQVPENVIELSTKSFFNGYWTYRLLNTGASWVIAKFRLGNLARLLECRVCGADGVCVADKPGGIQAVEIGGRSVSPVDLSPEMRQRLLHSLRAGMSSTPIVR